MVFSFIVLFYVILPLLYCHNEFTKEACLEAHNRLRSQHVNTQPVKLSDQLTSLASRYASQYATIDTTRDVRTPAILPKRRKRKSIERISLNGFEDQHNHLHEIKRNYRDHHRERRHVSDIDPNIHLELWDGDILYPDGSWNRIVGNTRVGESIHKFCCTTKPHCPKEFFNNLLFPPSADGVINDWYAQEINNYDFDTGTKVTDTVQVKHFSNIVWRNTTEIGCAQSIDLRGECYFTVVLYRLEGSVGTPEIFKNNIGAVIAAEEESETSFILIIFLSVLFVAILISLIVLCYCCRDRIRDKYLKVKIKTDTMKAEQELETDSTRFWWLRMCRRKRVKQRRRTTVTRPKTSIKERPTIEVVPNSPPPRSRPVMPRERGQSNAADFLMRYQGIGKKAENYVPYRDRPLTSAPRDPNSRGRPLPSKPVADEIKPLNKQPAKRANSHDNDVTKRPVHRSSSSGKPPPPPVPQLTSQPERNPLVSKPHVPPANKPVLPPVTKPQKVQSAPQPKQKVQPPPQLPKLPKPGTSNQQPGPPLAMLPPKQPNKDSPKESLRPVSVPVNQNKPKPVPRKNTAPIEETTKPSPPLKPKPPPKLTNENDEQKPLSIAERRKFLEQR